MLKPLTSRVVSADIFTIAVLIASPCNAAQPTPTYASPLLQLATARFSNLTRAEHALLEHADVRNVGRGDYAVCGPSANPDAASNDPKDAAKWDPQREIRASLIRWMIVDPDAIRQIDPQGIRVLGARITGTLNLSQVRVPFAIVMRRCATAEPMKLVATSIPDLDLSGSYTGEIDASGLDVGSELNLDDGFHASGQVNVGNAKVGGNLNLANGHLRHSAVLVPLSKVPFDAALNAVGISVGGWAVLCCGFEADGVVNFDGASIGHDFWLYSGRFLNPNKHADFGDDAFRAVSSTIEGDVLLNAPWGEPFQSDGLVNFDSVRIGNNFFADHVKFMGAPNELHGLMLTDLGQGTVGTE